MTSRAIAGLSLDSEAADHYADRFGCLAEPTRIRILHVVARAGDRGVTVGSLSEALEISQSTCSHHLRKLADLGYVLLRSVGNATSVSIDESCFKELPQAADAVLGLLAPGLIGPRDLSPDVEVRALQEADWGDVLRIYGEGIATGLATFETRVPPRRRLEKKWLAAHRWVAEVDGRVVGWTAATAVSDRECYAGVAETSIYVGDGSRGRGVGKALLLKQVTEADRAGLWTLQTSIFTDNRASIALHHAAGYRTVGIRDRIAQRAGHWQDTVLLERHTD